MDNDIDNTRYTKKPSPMGWFVHDGEKDTGIVFAVEPGKGIVVRRHGIWQPSLAEAIKAYEAESV